MQNVEGVGGPLPLRLPTNHHSNFYSFHDKKNCLNMNTPIWPVSQILKYFTNRLRQLKSVVVKLKCLSCECVGLIHQNNVRFNTFTWFEAVISTNTRLLKNEIDKTLWHSITNNLGPIPHRWHLVRRCAKSKTKNQ